jgi:hypothetical protein
MGVLVMEGRLDGAEARLLRKGSRGIMRVKADIPEPGHKRFAIAHELGHWLLHGSVSQVLACTSEDMVAQYKESEPEIEANYFASALLMPEFLFRPRLRGTRTSVGLVQLLAEEFGTSLTATFVRYVELVDDYCAVVFSEGGRVRWWRASPRFECSFWVDPGTPLSEHTVAGSVFRGKAVPPRPESVDLVEWLPEAEDLDADSIMEQVVWLERYGQAISLLWLP